MLLRPRLPHFANRAVIAVAIVCGSVSLACAQTPPAVTPLPAPAAAPAAQSAPIVQPSQPAAPADPYTVSGIKVDVSADNANVARDKAIAEAQAKAWVELARRLSPTGDAPPKMSDADLQRVVLGISVDDEKVTPTRYLASISVRFRADAVRNHFAGTSAQYVEPPGKAYVVLPVTMVGGKPVLWDDHTAWRDAWEGKTASALVPTMVPPGELPDVSAIGAAEAASADPQAIDRIVRKYNAPGAIVVRTTLPDPGQPLPPALKVDITRVDANGDRKDTSLSVRKDPDDRPEDLLRRAVIQTSAAIDDLYRQGNAITAGPEQTIQVTLAIAGLPDWLEARQRLTGTAGITSADMVSLGRSAVKLNLVYRGDPTTLRQALGKRDLGLEDAGGEYLLRLLPRGSGSAAAAPSPVAPVAAPGAMTAPARPLAPPTSLAPAVSR